MKEFEEAITLAYLGRRRDLIGMCTNLQCEAAELAELVVKKQWYFKEYKKEDLISEAGDVLNFLAIILQTHGSNLQEAMEDNIKKLRKRGWT